MDIRESESRAHRPDGLLYHYTSSEGLMGILRSNSIFATHIRYLNDTQELYDSLACSDAFLLVFHSDDKAKYKRFDLALRLRIP